MAAGKWKVFGNNVCGKKYYQVGRMRDVTGAVHSGNVEYYREEMFTDPKCAQELAERLNRKEGGS